MRQYQALTPEQVEQYKNMTPEQLGQEKEKYGIRRNIRYQDIEFDEPFKVINGDFLAFVDTYNNRVYSNVIVDTGDVDIVRKDITVKYNNNEEANLSIRYLKDAAATNEIRLIQRDITLIPNMGGKESCRHEYISQWNGLICIHCKGVFCY